MSPDTEKVKPTPTRLEIEYTKSKNKDREYVGKVARLMIKTGAANEQELDFILGVYPDTLQDWATKTPDAQAILEEFKDSDRFCSWALARTFHLTYDHVYRALQQSPIRPYIGDFTIDQTQPYYDNSTQPVRVRVVEPRGADLSCIRQSYLIEKGFNAFSLEAQTYLQNLRSAILGEENESQRRVLQGVYDFYKQVQDLRFEALVTKIPDQQGQPRRDKFGNEIPFPSSHQKAAIIKAAQEGSLAVFDGTGSGKTGIGIGLTEYLGARRTLVICPANVKDTWIRRIQEYYLDNPGVIRVDSQSKQRVANGERYTVVNYELLINRISEGAKPIDILSSLTRRFLEAEFDLLIVDEGHYINNPNSRSNAVMELARRINHRLILTATPIRNSVDDIARIAHLLSPNEFSTPEALRDLKQAGISPLSELLATKTIRRRTEDLLELPPFCPENNGKVGYAHLDLNPTQRAVYDTIYDDYSLDSLTKLILLRLTSIDHNLVRGGKYKIPFEEQQAIRELNYAYKTWVRQKDKGNNVKFNSDFLVTHGYRYLFIGAHFQYRKGIDQLIQKHSNQETKEAWKGVVESTKFQIIKELVAQRLAKNEKVVVFSGHFVQGVLREVVDDATGETISESLYAYLNREFPDIGLGRIDGEVSAAAPRGKLSQREEERRRWQKDPNYKILLTSIPSSALGIDLTVNDGVTQGVGIIGVDLPYTYADFWQMISRVYRFGQLTPVNVWITEAINTVDQGVHILIDKKGEVSRQLLDGLSPDELARRVMDRSKTREFLVDYITSPRKELDKMMRSMRGEGATANGTYLEKISKDEKTIGEIIAELYSRYWEYTYSGHTARFLKQVIEGLRSGQKSQFNLIADAGSGPLILDRIMKQDSNASEELRVISIDINKHMLESGITEMQRMGYPVDRNLVVNRSMSNTGIRDGACDGAVCSLAFHYSSSSEDRGKILAEANRILRTGGYYFITLPESYVSPEQYRAFCKALRKFGFEVDKNISGKAKALDHKDVPFEIWLIAARKIGAPSKSDLTMEEFRFNFESPKISQFKGYSEDDNGKKQSKDQDRLVKHERFQILDPDNNFRSKGSPSEILARLGLGLDEEMIRRYGWRVEIRENQKGTTVVIRK